MAEALVAGLLRAKVTDPARILTTDIAQDRLIHMGGTYGVQVSRDNGKAVAFGEVVVVAVEPQVIDELLGGIAKFFKKDCLVISVAAGYPTSRLARHLPPTVRLIRTMSNTPCGIGEGVTALSLGRGATVQDEQLARRLFEAVGKVVSVEERLMDAVTGLSGSGPAYVYLMIEALADGGVKAGLTRQAAELLAAQTVYGAARMVVETEEHPGRLKDRVASPGGTTIAGLHKLETGRMRAALISAVETAAKRSKELGLG